MMQAEVMLGLLGLGANTGLLAGIFLRLGAFGSDIRNVRYRVEKLEEKATEVRV